MNDYKYTEEYRDRYGFNEGDINFITMAMTHYADTMKEEIKAMEDNGKTSMFRPSFFYQKSKDITSLLEYWKKELPVYEED
tara:strand:+ start:3492 stop:3734 length:243 start_codon:yes stop_codon:yes gene_type:complete